MSDAARLPGMPSPDRSSIVHEAFTLPLIFLTVALAGGFRSAETGMRFLPPSLMALVLAMLLVSVLVQGELLAAPRLMSAARQPVANLNGAVVLLSLFFATAQVFNSITPEEGLLYLLFNVFFVVLLWNTLAAGPVAERLLRSLLVVFGSAFVLKYVVLSALYDPEGGLAKRVLTVLLQGVTLGSLNYQPDAPVTGYVAFFTIVLYMIGLVLLPGSRRHHARPGDPARELPAGFN